MTFFWLVLALVLTPGATTAVVMRQALVGGRRAGVAAAAGAAVANTVQAIAARLGLALLLARLPALALAIRVGGALYLLWLAWKSLLRAVRPVPLRDRVGGIATAGDGSAFRDGLVVNLLNPPITTFYVVVVPGFLAPGDGAAAYARLAAIHIGLAFACHVGWSLIADRIRTAARSHTALRALDGAAAAALIFLAVRTLIAGTATR
jgi:threonine/homoserine/homoserine lactone efflux protein